MAHRPTLQRPLWGLGSAEISPQRRGVRGGAPSAVAVCCTVCSQNASGCSIFGPLASIAMSGEMKANPGSGRICYLLATYTPYNIIVDQTGKFNFCRVQNCSPLNFAALFGRTPRTCLRPALNSFVRKPETPTH